MTTPPSSSPLFLVFYDEKGAIIEVPHEWEPAWVEVIGVPLNAWRDSRLWAGETELEISPRKPKNFGPLPRLLAEWPRQGPGNYVLRCEMAQQVVERVFAILPRKITSADYERLLGDLDEYLPASLAIALQRLGGFGGVQFAPPEQSTLAQEMLRLRRAVRGDASRPGLAQALLQIAPDPHQVLRTNYQWTPSERARRPHAASLALAVARSDNLFRAPTLADAPQTRQVVDARVEHSVDVYENRLAKAFHKVVQSRLYRLANSLARKPSYAVLLEEVRQLQDELLRSHRNASFLRDVHLPSHLPNQVTMVLLRRPAYRAVLEGYVELHRSVSVRLEDPQLESPLQNLPHLYQVWGTLQVVGALLDEAFHHGFQVRHQKLFRRDESGYFIELVPDGQPLLVLYHPLRKTIVKLIPERSYRRTSATGLHSVSFLQKPDIAVEVAEQGVATRVFLFDPKYKLDSESLQANPASMNENELTNELFQEAESEEGGEIKLPPPSATPSALGRPKKVDIDKMHAYRDAIRDAQGQHAVEYAAILYPGSTKTYMNGLAALSAIPTRQDELHDQLRAVLREALMQTRSWVSGP